MDPIKQDPTAAYLIDRGWLPSPTTMRDAAWERHDFKIPRYFSKQAGLYDPDFVRVPTDTAVMVQLLLDRIQEDAGIRRLSLVDCALEVAAEWCKVTAQARLPR